MAFITQDVNVQFNGKLDDVIVLKDDGTNLTAIVANTVAAPDLAALEAVVDEFGGDAPMEGPVGARITYPLQGEDGDSVISSDFDSVDPSDAVAVVDFGTGITTETDIGLGGFEGPHGHQRVAFAQEVVGSASTGLVAGQTYTVSIFVDSAVAKRGLTGYEFDEDDTFVDVEILGSAAATFTTLRTALNAALEDIDTVVEFIGSNILVVSEGSRGYESKVRIVEDNLFRHVAGFIAVTPPVDGYDVVQRYSAQLVVDGKVYPISGTAANLVNVGDLYNVINAVVNQIPGADLVFVGDTFEVEVDGATTTQFVDGNLFSSVSVDAGEAVMVSPTLSNLQDDTEV